MAGGRLALAAARGFRSPAPCITATSSSTTTTTNWRFTGAPMSTSAGPPRRPRNTRRPPLAKQEYMEPSRTPRSRPAARPTGIVSAPETATTVTLPDLRMHAGEPRRVVPNLWHLARGWFFVGAIVKPYFDRRFNRADFLTGAAHAVGTVSQAMAAADFEALEPLLDPACLAHVKKTLSFASLEDRRALAVEPGSIYSSFIYEVGIILGGGHRNNPGGQGQRSTAAGSGGNDADDDNKRRWAELTYVGHSHPEAARLLEESSGPFEFSKAINRNGGPMVVNYRFLREYTRGKDPDETSWTVTSLDHFRLDDAQS